MLLLLLAGPAQGQEQAGARSFTSRDVSVGLGAGVGGAGGQFGISPAYSAVYEAGARSARVGLGISGAPGVNAAGPVDYAMPMIGGIELDGAFGNARLRAGPSVTTWLFIPVGVGARFQYEGVREGHTSALGAEARAYWLHHLLPGIVGPEAEGYLVTAELSWDWTLD